MTSKVLSETPNSITTRDTFGHIQTYQVMEKIPSGLHVWNIGENMGTDRYIPVCRMDGSYHIDPAYILAVPAPREDVLLLREAAQYGVTSLALAKKYAKKKGSSAWQRSQRHIARKVEPIFQKLTK